MEDLREIIVDGDSITSATHRLGGVVELIDTRRAALNAAADFDELPRSAKKHVGPAFVVHAHHFPALIADGGCREAVEHVARHGDRCGVVTLIYGDAGEVTEAAARAPEVAAALQRNRGMRMAPTREVPPGYTRRPETAEDAELWSELLSAELWVALVLGDLEGLAAVFAHLRTLGETPGGPTQRRLVSDGLRRAADTLLPGAGGTLPGAVVECPLCLASPLLRPDEVPSHLLAEHAPRSSPREDPGK